MRAGVRPRSAGNWRLAVWGAIATLLLLPLIAMQVTDEMAWDAADFAAAAILLVGAGAMFEIVARFTHDPRRRLLAGAAIVLAVLLIWAEAAVGVF